ncbi:heme lyase CcmF/NrfE family subunit [Zhaonella formicivorans]|uniref:heme lyase CcmF/NrfE family subunit n=1 Tax=Zhaonella formicivorans TaxID=2528593 RepID=UPI001D0F8926|nr:heme lyase CcmF/NrfE family subunit [Zhaonella formicivorans]
MADLGKLSLLVALAITVYAIFAYIFGLRANNKPLLESAKGGVLAIGFLTTVASVVLFYLLLISDFSVEYVYQYTSKNLPTFYKLSAFWAGNAGSLLLWAWLLGIYTTIVAYSKKHTTNATVPYVLIILLINSLFFLFLLNFVANPFKKLDFVPPEGAGLNPLLQNPGMVFHPITLYLGYVGFAVPFAFAMAALLTNRADDEWIRVTRRWSVIAWMFLTLGNLYGGQWAYVELGWGGYWGWDPVENASFIPWLTGTAFIHSVMIQERKDMLKGWNMVLIIVTYLLTLFGTFLVRSGVLTSVHAFGDSNLGTMFLVFIGIMLAFSLYLLIDRAHLLKEGNEFESYLSRESSFLMNNLLLVGSAFAVFWGTIFPLVSEAVRGVKVTVSVPFFNQVNAPILLAMLFVMGVCPLIAWQKSSWKKLRDNFLVPLLLALLAGVAIYFLAQPKKLYASVGFAVSFFVLFTIIQEFYRGTMARHRMTNDGILLSFYKLCLKNRRRWGGYIVHLGIVFMAFGIIGSNAYKVEVAKTVTYGEQIQIGDYVLTYNGLFEKQEGENTVVFAEMPVTYQGKSIGTVTPEKIFYANWEQPSTEVALKTNLKEDLYVILSTWDKGGEEATFKVNINPLMKLIWIGGYILVFGTIFAVWPGKGSELGPKYSHGVRKNAVRA